MNLALLNTTLRDRGPDHALATADTARGLNIGDPTAPLARERLDLGEIEAPAPIPR